MQYILNEIKMKVNMHVPHSKNHILLDKKSPCVLGSIFPFHFLSNKKPLHTFPQPLCRGWVYIITDDKISHESYVLWSAMYIMSRSVLTLFRWSHNASEAGKEENTVKTFFALSIAKSTKSSRCTYRISVSFSSFMRYCWKSSCINARPSLLHFFALANLEYKT